MCTKSILREFNSYKLLKRTVQLGPNSKNFQGFHPWTPIKGLRVIDWLARLIRVLPAFDF